MIIDPSKLNPQDVYKLLVGSVVPRPIAWVSTISKEGIYNLAPYSFFTVASRNPPTLCISVGEGAGDRKGTVKDTLANIREQKEFVINIVPSSLGNAMHKTAENVPAEVDEFSHAGLTPAKCEVVRAPRLKESPINMECTLEQIIPIGTDHLILGRMVCYHIQDDLYLGNYKVNLEKLKPLGRLAGNYSEINSLFELPRI